MRIGLLKPLFVSALVLAACGDDVPADPTPVIESLSCELAPYNDGYKGTFSFHYQDGDADLDGDGGGVRWWVDDVQQANLGLSGQGLGVSGTLVLNLSTFPSYELLAVRLQVVDDAGNTSNELEAELDTDPDRQSCEAVAATE